MKFLFAVLGVLVLAQGALAADAPHDLYATGKYREAIKAGIAQNNAGGFALAARAELAQETLSVTPCLPCLNRAENYARQAIAADPKNADGQIYLAVTLGYKARVVGMVTAKLGGYAEEAKSSLDAALGAEPANAWALAALAGWNIEIVRNGGATLAGMMYGASLDAGLADFAKAFKEQRGSLVLRYQYALTMSGFDLGGYRAQIEDALKRASTGAPATAYETAIRARAGALLNLLQKGEDDTYIAQVRRYQGYP